MGSESAIILFKFWKNPSTHRNLLKAYVFKCTPTQKKPQNLQFVSPPPCWCWWYSSQRRVFVMQIQLRALLVMQSWISSSFCHLIIKIKLTVCDTCTSSATFSLEDAHTHPGICCIPVCLHFFFFFHAVLNEATRGRLGKTNTRLKSAHRCLVYLTFHPVCVERVTYQL